MTYQPPYTITPEILNQVASICELLGQLTQITRQSNSLRLRRINRIRTIHGSLAIEGNTMSEAQISAILEGKRVIAPPREVQEVKNALAAYDRFENWDPHSPADLLDAHRILMSGLIDELGRNRSSGVGVMTGQLVIHMAPPSERVPQLMQDLFAWLATTDIHPLLASSIFHYEFEFIHPFADGNGRMGRLWQSLILANWNPLFANMPVESLIFEHQADYYRAIKQSSDRADSGPFIAFMLKMIWNTLTTSTPEAAPEATPEVRLLYAMQGEMSRLQLKTALGLKDDEHFRKAYLVPALAKGWIEMTLPQKPRSPNQKYRISKEGQKIVAHLG
ncbi:MAG: Fic family protein [Acidobacteria bacterium]|nr:Fic family protein [Acidobacteriota bacterium]MCB9399027.1 Fic family protein [Acidobacteriota bacterium]